MNLKTYKLNSKEFFANSIADIRAGYGYADENKTFEKTLQMLKEWGATENAFESLAEFEAWEKAKIKSIQAGTWNKPKNQYNDPRLSLNDRNKAYFDHVVKRYQNDSGFYITDAWEAAYRHRNYIFPTFEKYIEYLNQQTLTLKTKNDETTKQVPRKVGGLHG